MRQGKINRSKQGNWIRFTRKKGATTIWNAIRLATP